jgi:hypothetical protein
MHVVASRPHMRSERSLALRLAVARRRSALDSDLAAGISPEAGPDLALRAHQLSTERECRAIAAALRNLVDAAEESPAAWRAHGSDPPLRSEEVLRAKQDLIAVAGALEGRHYHPLRAVALASLLAAADDSPIYVAPASGDDVSVVAARLRNSLGERVAPFRLLLSISSTTRHGRFSSR